MSSGGTRAATVALVLGVASGPAAGDEAFSRDGRRLGGTLLLRQGQLVFRPAGGSDLLAAGALQRVRLDALPPQPFPVGGGCRVHLQGGQQLTGVLLSLDGKRLRLRTAWAARLEVPRSALVCLTALPGWRLRFADDFRDGMTAWAKRGQPPRVDRGGPAVVLEHGGQVLAYTLPRPLNAGRIGVNVAINGKASQGRWALQLAFTGPDKVEHCWEVLIGGDGVPGRVVRLGEPQGQLRGVPAGPGPRRLLVHFRPDSLRVLVDESVLWHTLKDGPAGALREVRLVCTEADGRGLAWADFTLEEAVAESPHPPGDPGQDEVWLDCGDQLFGRVLRADRKSVELERSSGRRSVAWTQVQGLYFHHPAAANPSVASIRVGIESCLANDLDILEGQPQALDDTALILHHDVLGTLRLPRWVLREARPGPPGAR
jgi:hypothetical protein